MAIKNQSNFEKMKFFLLGVLVAISLAVIMGASSASFGRYQVSAWSGSNIGFGAFIVDTTTGETKMVYLNSGVEEQNHLGMPFNAF